MHKQLWSPDTCGCIFEQVWEEGGEPQVSEIIYKCPDHSDYSQSLKDNQLKNQVLGELLENKVLPNTLMDDISTYDEKTRSVKTSKTLNQNVNFKYYFKNGKINFAFEGIDKNGQPVNLTNTTKGNISAVLNHRLGMGKHEVKDALANDPEYEKAVKIRSYRDQNYGKLTAKYRELTKEEVEEKTRLQKLKELFK